MADLTNEQADDRDALICALLNLLEFVKGNRGSKTGNPYGKREVREALDVLVNVGVLETWQDDTDLCRADD